VKNGKLVLKTKYSSRIFLEKRDIIMDESIVFYALEASIFLIAFLGMDH
jgi:hypothetical protein